MSKSLTAVLSVLAVLAFLAYTYLKLGRNDQEAPPAAKPLIQAGTQALQRQDYAGAEKSLLAALRLLRGRDQNWDRPSTLSLLGVVYTLEERYSEAEESFNRALNVIRQHPHADPAIPSAVLRNMASLYRRQKLYSAAELRLREALRGFDNTLPGRESKAAGDAAADLADICSLEGKDDEAEILFARAVGIEAKTRTSSELARRMHRLALIYEAKGKPEAARNTWQEVLRVRDLLRMPGDADLAIALEHYGALLRQTDPDRSRTLLRSAAEWRRKLKDARNDPAGRGTPH